jgi:hypothetical protein
MFRGGDSSHLPPVSLDLPTGHVDEHSMIGLLKWCWKTPLMGWDTLIPVSKTSMWHDIWNHVAAVVVEMYCHHADLAWGAAHCPGAAWQGVVSRGHQRSQHMAMALVVSMAPAASMGWDSFGVSGID